MSSINESPENVFNTTNDISDEEVDATKVSSNNFLNFHVEVQNFSCQMHR
jgi:hypothetical protein